MKESFNRCLKKQQEVIELFEGCSTQEEKYQKIILLGKKLAAYPDDKKLTEYVVEGCQSTLFLYSECNEGKMNYYAHSDALISAGLAYLLLHVYNGEPPEIVLKCPPKFLEVLDIPASLTPGRSNGLASLFLKMKQQAIKFLVLA